MLGWLGTMLGWEVRVGTPVPRGSYRATETIRVCDQWPAIEWVWRRAAPRGPARLPDASAAI